MEPRLTIGIPTQGKRPELLLKAIGSALAQTEPVVVLVANQDDGAREAMKAYRNNPQVRNVVTSASSLWGNWTAAAEACDTEYFAWLQDDDIVSRHLAARVNNAFKIHPKAAFYIARLGISRLPDLANWWEAAGPPFPADLLDGVPQAFDGELATVAAYFTSLTLSPAVAFRMSPEAVQAVRNVPDNADLFAERSILAELARLGRFVFDPLYAGYWVHHSDNESTKQNKDIERRAEQFTTMCRHIDALIDDIPDWKQKLRALCVMAGHDSSNFYHKQTRGHEHRSRHLAEARAVIRELYQDIADAPGRPDGLGADAGAAA